MLGKVSQALVCHAGADCIRGAESLALDSHAGHQVSRAADRVSLGHSMYQPDGSKPQADIAVGMHTLSAAGTGTVLDEEMSLYAPSEHAWSAQQAQNAVADDGTILQCQDDAN